MQLVSPKPHQALFFLWPNPNGLKAHKVRHPCLLEQHIPTTTLKQQSLLQITLDKQAITGSVCRKVDNVLFSGPDEEASRKHIQVNVWSWFSKLHRAEAFPELKKHLPVSQLVITVIIFKCRRDGLRFN